MRKISRVLSLLVAVAVLIGMTASSVSAQSNGLGVSPRKDYNVEAGKTVTDTIYISNLSLNQDLQVNLRVIDFGAQNETGAPALQLADNAPQTPWSLRPFMKLPSKIQVGAGKSVNIPVSITIPAGQGAGSYYSAIEYTAVNPETKQKVNIAASTASLVFVTVPGTTKEQLLIKQYGVWDASADQTTGAFKSFYFGSTPKEFAYRLQNEGNVAEQPSGSMLIKNMFGSTAKEIDDANPKKQLVLIGQTRRIQVCIKSSVLDSQAPSSQTAVKSTCDNPGLLPGRYTAQIALYYGLNGASTQELQATSSFWYFPTWSVVGLVILLIILFILGWLIRRAFGGGANRRRYRR